MPTTALTALLPLEPPPTPPPPWWGELLPLAVVLLLILALLWWWRRPASRHARRLKTLQRRLAQPGSDTRTIAAELKQLLRDATGRSHLSQPSNNNDADWQALLTQLQQARFQRDPPTVSELNTLLPLARQLIRDGHV